MRTHGFNRALFCLAVALLGACADASPGSQAAATTKRSATARVGVAWETSLAAAKARAARSGKPLLLLHLFGRLDEEFC
jgi:hypothetical protein